MGLRFLRADKNMLLGAGVTTIAGTDDSTHPNTQLVDGRNRPARATTGTATWLIEAGTAALIQVVVLHSHTIDAARTITIGGDVSQTAVGLAVRPNQIPPDLWIPLTTPASGTDVSIGVAGNSKALIIAEALAGPVIELETGFDAQSTEIGYLDVGGTVPRQSKSGSVLNFGRGLIARYISGEFIVTPADADALMAAYEATFEEVRPSAFLLGAIPAFAPLEAFVGGFGAKPVITSNGAIYKAHLVLHEMPRKRWILS